MRTTSSGYARPNTDRRYDFFSFVRDAEHEFAASAVREVSVLLPWIARIAKDRSPIEYEREPIAARPEAPLSVEQAAECAMQVSAVLAELHARGWVGLGAGARDIRVFREGERWRAEVVVPHMPAVGKWQTNRGTQRRNYWELGAWKQDVITVAGFFVDLVAGYVPVESWTIPRSAPVFELPATIDEHARSGLSSLLTGKASPRTPNDAAELAALFATLTTVPSSFSALVSSLPHARPTALRRDWRRLCELGDGAIARTPRSRNTYEYLALALANAHHQRAVELFNERSFAAAIEHVERSVELDPHSRYLCTKGTIECAMGEHRASIATLDTALSNAKREAKSRRIAHHENPSREIARAAYARAIARWHAGERSKARADLSAAANAIEPARKRAADAGRSTRELRELEKRIRAAQAKLDAT